MDDIDTEEDLEASMAGMTDDQKKKHLFVMRYRSKKILELFHTISTPVNRTLILKAYNDSVRSSPKYQFFLRTFIKDGIAPEEAKKVVEGTFLKSSLSEDELYAKAERDVEMKFSAKLPDVSFYTDGFKEMFERVGWDEGAVREVTDISERLFELKRMEIAERDSMIDRLYEISVADGPDAALADETEYKVIRELHPTAKEFVQSLRYKRKVMLDCQTRMERVLQSRGADAEKDYNIMKDVINEKLVADVALRTYEESEMKKLLRNVYPGQRIPKVYPKPYSM